MDFSRQTISKLLGIFVKDTSKIYISSGVVFLWYKLNF